MVYLTCIIAYLVLLGAIALWKSREVKNQNDFAVAGRSLSLEFRADPSLARPISEAAPKPDDIRRDNPSVRAGVTAGRLRVVFLGRNAGSRDGENAAETALASGKQSPEAKNGIT